MIRDHGFYLPDVKTKRLFGNRPLSNRVTTKEQSRDRDNKFAFPLFVQRKLQTSPLGLDSVLLFLHSSKVVNLIFCYCTS